MIIASCRHEIQSVDDGHTAIRKGMSRDGTLSIEYSTLCPSCYKKAQQAGDLFINTEHAEHWLNEENFTDYCRYTLVDLLSKYFDAIDSGVEYGGHYFFEEMRDAWFEWDAYKKRRDALIEDSVI